jgi:hypothetical protein
VSPPSGDSHPHGGRGPSPKGLGRDVLDRININAPLDASPFEARLRKGFS